MKFFTILKSIFALKSKSDLRIEIDVFDKLKENSIIIDLRTPKELVSTGIIPGAIHKNIYDQDFNEWIQGLDHKKEYIVYCKIGGRSALAAKQMNEQGLNVKDYSGGITQWVQLNRGTTHEF